MERITARRRPGRPQREIGGIEQRPWKQLTRSYAPIEILSADQVRTIHEMGLTILEEIGMRVLQPQARQFYRSMTAPEQRHIQNALSFELSKVEAPSIRQRMLGHLAIVDDSLAQAIAEAIGMEGEAAAINPFREPIDLDKSPALSLIGKAAPTLRG